MTTRADAWKPSGVDKSRPRYRVQALTDNWGVVDVQTGGRFEVRHRYPRTRRGKLLARAMADKLNRDQGHSLS